MLSDPARRELLHIARDAMTARVTGRAPTPGEPEAELAQPSGAFVTLTTAGQLRGCIGSVEATERLADVVRRCAGAAAIDDPRFPPVAEHELDEIVIEISVLAPPRDVSDPCEIEIGRDGLIVALGPRRGLLLPQVAVEWGWDRDTFLRQTCVKAGLAPDAWRSGARVFRFEAEVFGERAAP